MKWITRKNIKVDRVACPWLIRRFIDSDALFLFVAEDELLNVAAGENAIPCHDRAFDQVCDVVYHAGVFLLFNKLRNAIPTLATLFVMVGPAPAQWVKLPLVDTPRTPDGKPNLTAPAPRTPDGKPDLSGIWTTNTGAYLNNLAGEGAEVPMQPWAAAVYKERHDSFGRDKPQVRCLPHGVPDGMLVPGYPFKMIQTPRETVILQEEFNQFRQIFVDGRSLPVDPTPAWFGFSVAKWEGDTFVVESAGFNDGTWLDNGGHPHTDALHLTERFRRINFGNMELDITIDDSKAYTRPWKSVTVHFILMPDTELIEHLCENEKDAPHLLGK